MRASQHARTPLDWTNESRILEVTMAKWRTIQPPHPSENFTLEEAMEAWRKVEARMAAEGAKKSRRRPRSSAPVVAKVPSGSSLAAERAERSED
jgi:hypothetical protein